MENQKSTTDIYEIIKTVKELITKNNPEDLKEPLYTLEDYVHKNISIINKNSQLKQQIADCLLIGGKKRLDKFPDRYGIYFYWAVAYFLIDDIDKLCENMIFWFNEGKNNADEPYTNNHVASNISFFHANLANKSWHIFFNKILKFLEKNYPDTAAIYYVKSLEPSLDNNQILDYLSKAIELDKDFSWVLWDIAWIFSNNKNYKNAISYYNRYIEINKRNDYDVFNVSAYSHIAWCYDKIKDYDNAIIYNKKCLEINPEYQYAMNNLGYAYEQLKDYGQALSCYEKSIKSGKDGKFPYYNTFRLLKKLKRYDEAIEFWEANKKKFSLSFQKDVDKLREIKNKKTQQQLIQENIEEEVEIEIEAVPEQPIQIDKGKVSKKANNSFLAESRLEDEIEVRISNGLQFFPNLLLRMYDSIDGYGRQYIIPGIGRIDILAVNTTNNDFYVIELKKGHGDDEIVGQVSRYMGWVKKNLASESQNVYGIICVAQTSEKLKYAAEANPNISIYNYSIQVTPV
ncbi:MAG: endonuclease NucS [Oscillospiraceae bacterium]|nr:endonuclease NucS [Oscillospiraceae bacterium]